MNLPLLRTGKRLDQRPGFSQELFTLVFFHTLSSEPSVLIRAELLFGPGENREEKAKESKCTEKLDLWPQTHLNTKVD